MICSACAAESPDHFHFCLECGTPLSRNCSACGSVLPAPARFCGSCGLPLVPTAPPANPATARPGSVHAPEIAATRTERRHVSVLFCDLVGFTPLAESRDPEEVRELLSGYFDLARAVVGRYGGVIQKFIGDAVMAVWGAPVTNEDDAERAVRAGLELISGVASYGEEQRVVLAARVGIVTGGAATTETIDEGLVIGDRVNTAARIQSIAPAGSCYVDELTRAASAAAVAYLDAGTHLMKGKSEAVHLFHATRVIAATAGSQRASVLEAPFTGRDLELRLMKELFHAATERRSARLVVVSGVAGVGKSRLAWEFFKYIDGLAGDVLWHAGRCLSYGDGVSYSALTEIVRARLQIGEDDPPDVVAERLDSGLQRWIPDDGDRRYISPRLGQLVGLASAQVLAREELFAGWRLFIERLAQHLPVVIVIEDLQWADAGMVEFLDYLLEWSREQPIFVVVLSRPEGVDRRGLELTRRSATTLPLDPLDDRIIGELLDALVADLPAPARARIVERSEGIPLYAVETVRSLLDKGVLTRGADDRLHLVGELGPLETPPGLTALIASRLDSLSPAERTVVKECSVLGETFSGAAITAVSDSSPGELADILGALVRKEVLTVRADKLSPERGNYAFTQSLIRSVAYEMLSRTERKERHRRTANHLRAASPDGGADIAEIVAAHLDEAQRAAGDDDDADELRAAAHAAYVHAAEQAVAVGNPEGAESAYLRAAELGVDAARAAGLIDQAGRMASRAGADERALLRFEKALARYRESGQREAAVAVTAWIGRSLFGLGRHERAITVVRDALASVDGGRAAPAVIAELHHILAIALTFTGHREEADASNEVSLRLAQHYELGGILAGALVVKGGLLAADERVMEARLYLESAIEVAQRHGSVNSEASAQGNLGDLLMTHDLPGAREHFEALVGLSRRWGARQGEAFAMSNLMYVLTLEGRFDEAYRLGSEVLESAGGKTKEGVWVHGRLALLDVLCGRRTSARAHFAYCEDLAHSDDVQSRAGYATIAGALALGEGEASRALGAATSAIEGIIDGGLAISHEAVRVSYPVAIGAAVALQAVDDLDRLVQLFASRSPGEIPPFLTAQVRRAAALREIMRATGHDDTIEQELAAVEASLHGLEYPYWHAVSTLERAEWLLGKGRPGDAAVAATNAATTFAQLGAESMLTRARATIGELGNAISHG